MNFRPSGERVTAGQPVKITEGLWNTLGDVAAAYRASTLPQGAGSIDGIKPVGTISALCLNSGSFAIEQGEPVRYGPTPVTVNAETRSQSEKSPLLSCSRVSGVSNDNMGIALDPIPVGRVGRVCLHGLCVANIYNRGVGGSDSAGLAVGGATGFRLESNRPGPVRMLGGGAAAGGTGPTLVALSLAPSPVEPITYAGFSRFPFLALAAPIGGPDPIVWTRFPGSAGQVPPFAIPLYQGKWDVEYVITTTGLGSSTTTLNTVVGLRMRLAPIRAGVIRFDLSREIGTPASGLNGPVDFVSPDHLAINRTFSSPPSAGTPATDRQSLSWPTRVVRFTLGTGTGVDATPDLYAVYPELAVLSGSETSWSGNVYSRATQIPGYENRLGPLEAGVARTTDSGPVAGQPSQYRLVGVRSTPPTAGVITQHRWNLTGAWEETTGWLDGPPSTYLVTAPIDEVTGEPTAGSVTATLICEFSDTDQDTASVTFSLPTE
jgi:hypothetical protein